MQSPRKRQTVSYLSQRFMEVGLEPNKRHGQNFLIDYNLIELLARSAQVQSNDVVLEVGMGTGALTALLAPDAAHVITVEIDKHLVQLASEELESFSNITILHQDVLKSKNRIHPAVLEKVREKLAANPGSRLKLASNLPYNIATPLISNLLRWEIVPDSMTITIQKELADRMMASPSTKDYGALSVWVQSLCEITLVRVMPPSVFWPRPKVDSAIIHLVHRPEWRSLIPDTEFLHKFGRAMFFHRRKFMRSVAISAFKEELTKPEVDEVLQAAGLLPNARTETLSVSELQSLCELFRQQLIRIGKYSVTAE